MFQQARIAFIMLVAMTVLTGLVYPLVITGFAKAVFPDVADGSLIVRDGHAFGSEFIGQPFSAPKYFWSRPSATSPMPYNAASSSGSNLAIGTPAQLDAIRARVSALKAVDPDNKSPVPIDLVTASGSGLDPHISPAAAHFQAARVAKARGMEIAAVDRLIEQHTLPPQWGLLGQPRVNVLLLNLELDHAGWGMGQKPNRSWKDPI